MPGPSAPAPSTPDSPENPRARRRPPLLIVLAAIVAVEALLAAALALYLVFELLTVTPQSYTTAIAIIVLVALAAAWGIVTFVGIVRLQSWARASTVTIQILVIAVAVAGFQGLVASPEAAWALLVAAVAGGLLAVAPSVVRATAASRERDTETHE